MTHRQNLPYSIAQIEGYMEFSRTFKNTKGQPFTVEITLAALKRAKLIAGWDIDAEIAIPDAKPGVSKEASAQEAIRPIQALLADQFRFCNVLYAILKPQADAAGLTQNDFDESLNGECVEASQQAFYAGLYDFFPTHSPKRNLIRGVAEAMMRTLNLMKRTQAKREAATEQAVQAMDREFQAAMTEADQAIAEASSKLASGSPANVD